MRAILITLAVTAVLMVLLRIFVPASFVSGSAILFVLALLRIVWLLIFRRKAG